MELRSTKQLLGRAGERFLLLGMLSRSKEGKLCLEDADGDVELDFSTLDEPGDGLFTEGSFALVEGEYTEDATLQIIAIGQPPCESRQTARSIYGHIDFLGKGSTSLLEDVGGYTIEESSRRLVRPPFFLSLRRLVGSSSNPSWSAKDA
ncbi:hypothetical protein D9758_008856 [Tetrapyrgos nigripes]|uniref:Uncharacterized protein n=1 Tax=Tetrapyrgos nigripes TaxID=182062 RepID=A0A8H5FNV7_9AGAR|nr:hypothetical protein D9758_008856 [Tetrapyrgos nigripes]